MAKYTDEQIKKALKRCKMFDTDTDWCDCSKECLYNNEGCRQICADALDLINRQEAEKAELKETVDFLSLSAEDSLYVFRENHRLKSELAYKERQLQQAHEEQKNYLTHGQTNLVKYTIKEVVKRIKAEILKNTVGNDSFAYLIFGYIDKAEKEMVGESK